MGNMATENAAGNRILSVLDAGSFVEIGGAVTARTTDFNMQDKETPADGVVTGYGVSRRKSGVCVQPGCIRIKRCDR